MAFTNHNPTLSGTSHAARTHSIPHVSTKQNCKASKLQLTKMVLSRFIYLFCQRTPHADSLEINTTTPLRDDETHPARRRDPRCAHPRCARRTSCLRHLPSWLRSARYCLLCWRGLRLWCRPASCTPSHHGMQRSIRNLSGGLLGGSHCSHTIDEQHSDK